ncbi:DUF6493 family protein [Flavobacterium collinsii]|uniref:WGR domain-containing protein n=1 Tax=Flavobacterium collinsii TaxID=1114861 RepID=A0ABN7EGA4_9FLAO|nr:DUF6493 family protein [Flavobacterium collinsii]CAA9196098.1 hypothetical protein FLACOL7796_00972 [Flavobacterium collinsii]
MKKSLKHIDGNSDKFWEIEVTGSQFKVTYGKNGTAGISQTKSFATEEECLKTAEKLVAEKIKKGYSETDDVRIVLKPKTDKAVIAAILQEYDDIIKTKDIDRLLPFLKKNSEDNIEALKKHIKECKSYWTEYVRWVPKNKETYNIEVKPGMSADLLPIMIGETRGDSIQKEIITLSAIALFSRNQINPWDEALHLLDEADQKPYVLEVLQWARPDWLETFILGKVRRSVEWLRFRYTILRQFEELGLIQFNPELFAMCLALSNDWKYEKGIEFVIAKFLADKTAYQRDIPEIFNYETAVHKVFFRYNGQQSDNLFSIWALFYKSLLDEKKMDRAFFFKNTIQIQTKEWKNDLKTFFRKRIEEFNPTEDELIIHQENIFSLLHCSFPPITSYGIDLVKKIYDHPKFNAQSFLEWLEPLMMRSDCKTAIKNVLPILEKLSEANPKLNTAITSIIAHVYVIEDLTLQERATKIIMKIANAKDEALKEKLLSYGTLIQGSIKFDLAAFLGQDALTIADTSFEEYRYIPKKELLLIEEVTLPKDWNAILFQFGKFISSRKVLDTEILMNAYIQQLDLFPDDYSEQLQPYVRQIERESLSLHQREMKRFLCQKIANINVKFDGGFRNRSEKTINGLSLRLLEKIQLKMESNSKLPLLSFPSHKPYWIAPKVLLERIIAYQKTNEEIDFVDLAFAIARMPREKVEEAIALLDQVEGELKPLLSFCLGVSEKIEFNTTSLASKDLPEEEKGNQENMIAVWAVAARTFYPTAVFPEFETTYLKNIFFVGAPYNPEVIINKKWSDWTFEDDSYEKYGAYSYRRNSEWLNIPSYYKLPNECLLYSLNIYHDEIAIWVSVNSWHSYTPQNSDALGIFLLRFRDGGQPKLQLKAFLNLTSKPEFQFSNITLFLFCSCFFEEDKEIRLLAAEELINLVERQEIDMDAFAQKQAFLVSRNHGRFTRIADGIGAIKDVSPLQNSALLKFFNVFFAHLELQELPTNFKKMVENYVDVLIKTNQKPAEKVITFFEQWKDNASLKSLIKQILK